MKIDEIKTYYERAKGAKLSDGDTDYQKQEEFLFWMLDSGHLGILIEQAKDKKLEQENKRYREVIENAQEHLIHAESYKAFQILRKALEESE